MWSIVGNRFLTQTLVAWKTIRLPRVRYRISVRRIIREVSSTPSTIVAMYSIDLTATKSPTAHPDPPLHLPLVCMPDCGVVRGHADRLDLDNYRLIRTPTTAFLNHLTLRHKSLWTVAHRSPMLSAGSVSGQPHSN